jgi:putative membrane protein
MMDLALTLTLWLHLLSLSLGGAAVFGVPALGTMLRKAEPAQRPPLAKAVMRLAALGRTALMLLVLTGGVLLWGRWAEGGLGGWFTVKMVLVVAMVGLAVFNVINGKRAAAGDAAAVARLPMLWLAGMLVLAGVVLAAVITFN